MLGSQPGRPPLGTLTLAAELPRATRRASGHKPFAYRLNRSFFSCSRTTYITIIGEAIGMPKRKRDDDGDARSGAVASAQQQRVQFKLKQGIVKLGHAFKIAKGFERQKLGRRRKNALTQKNEKDVQRIDAETGALKVRREYPTSTSTILAV